MCLDTFASHTRFVSLLEETENFKKTDYGNIPRHDNNGDCGARAEKRNEKSVLEQLSRSAEDNI